MEIDLAGLKQVLHVDADSKGGWQVELACGHTVWYPKVPAKQIPCGKCAQRLIRQIQALCAGQCPPGAYIR